MSTPRSTRQNERRREAASGVALAPLPRLRLGKVCDVWRPDTLTGHCSGPIVGGFACWVLSSLLCGALSPGSAVDCCAVSRTVRVCVAFLLRVCVASRTHRAQECQDVSSSSSSSHLGQADRDAVSPLQQTSKRSNGTLQTKRQGAKILSRPRGQRAPAAVRPRQIANHITYHTPTIDKARSSLQNLKTPVPVPSSMPPALDVTT